MKTLYIIVATLCLAVVFTADIESENGVLIITDHNFETALKNYHYILFEFFVPWCSRCKDLDPPYGSIAHNLTTHGSQIKLAKIDAANETALAERFDVQEYPTYIFHHAGTFVEYKGEITFEDILSLENP